MINELKRELSKLSGVDFFNPKYAEVFKRYLAEEEPKAEEIEETEPVKVENNENKVEELKTDIDKAEDEREIDKIEEEKAETPEKEEEKAEEVKEESEEIGKKVDDLKDNYADELFDAKLELALVKNNVRDDRMEAAKRFIKNELVDKDFTKINDILKEYPEWIKSERPKVANIGMTLNEDDGLTAEERKLKQMGIDINK